MVKMTPERIVICYELGKQVYDGRNKENAIGELVDKHGMKEGSAGRYIQAFASIMNGKVFQSVNQSYVIYHFEKTFSDCKKEQIEIALISLEKHIYYYANNRTKPSNVDELRKLHNQYSKKYGIGLTYESTPPYRKIKSS